MLLILLSISLCFSRVSPESHSLRYYYISMLNSNDFPEFIHVGVLDDVQITYFDSVIKKDIPRQPWMRTSLKDQYWEQETQRLIDRQRLSLANVEIAQQRTNSSKQGLNYLQYTSGCEVLEDGTVTGKRQYAFNGQELISFDLDHSLWVAASPYAVSTQNKWNSNKDDNEYKKQYTKRICVDWLNTYHGYGQAFLNRKEKGGSVVPGVIGAIIAFVLLIFCIGAGYYYMKHKDEVKKRFHSCFTHGSESSGSSTSCEGSQTLHSNGSDTSESAKPLVTPPSSDTSSGDSVQEPLVMKPDPSLTDPGAAPDHMMVEIEK
ncbi:major histocompatibility complex class I-related gene protein-like isoform X2 [Hemiscyllium ocellatum]|uniref:major histocompatibility complex class I-related gene protein-like isoform X2 n=1 Tax=Hemiscyllium ocellatum TaxID=170820 RepID=UPI00296696E5|nr:major histocompatibility complex class I-related gene protein-like isoform X2 [Hemiscyllium ocellatum]